MCNKISFPTRHDAVMFAHDCVKTNRKTKHKHAKTDRKQHPYECRFCGLWHLTTMPRKLSKVLEKARK